MKKNNYLFFNLTAIMVVTLFSQSAFAGQGNYSKIKNKAWGKCLNLQDHANKNGGLPNVWDCVTHPDQEWEIQNVGNGYVKIKNRAWGKCLNLQDRANKNGGLPNVWDCVTHPDQEWLIYDR
ncbi:MAG: hypothetical protein D3920_15965 [Candidatus Electrothrix sp. AW2]|nr:hypothetical protein [Candidatus Electrothrix gigas]